MLKTLESLEINGFFLNILKISIKAQELVLFEMESLIRTAVGKKHYLAVWKIVNTRITEEKFYSLGVILALSLLLTTHILNQLPNLVVLYLYNIFCFICISPFSLPMVIITSYLGYCSSLLTGVFSVPTAVHPPLSC